MSSAPIENERACRESICCNNPKVNENKLNTKFNRKNLNLVYLGLYLFFFWTNGFISRPQGFLWNPTYTMTQQCSSMKVFPAYDQWSTIDDQRYNDQRSMTNDQRSTINDHWSMIIQIALIFMTILQTYLRCDLIHDQSFSSFFIILYSR